jgi:hypothetical protein
MNVSIEIQPFCIKTLPSKLGDKGRI